MTNNLDKIYATLANYQSTYKMAVKAQELLTAKKATAEELAKVLGALAGRSIKIIVRGNYWNAPEQEVFQFDNGDDIVINRGLWISHVSAKVKKEDEEEAARRHQVIEAKPRRWADKENN